MASVLIKGLTLPKDDALSVIIYPDGVVEVQVSWIGDIPVYTNAFKATAIPVTEHGELKDYNDILKIFDKVLPNVDDATNELLCDLLVQIMYAPTVIPSTVKIPTDGIEPKGVWDNTWTTDAEDEGERTT